MSAERRRGFAARTSLTLLFGLAARKSVPIRCRLWQFVGTFLVGSTTLKRSHVSATVDLKINGQRVCELPILLRFAMAICTYVFRFHFDRFLTNVDSTYFRIYA